MARTALLVAIAWAMGLPALAASPLAHWGSFSLASENIVGGAFDLDILTNGPIDDPKTDIRVARVRYLLKRPVTTPDNPETTPVRTVADSRACPAIRKRLAALPAAETAQLAAPPPRHTVLDGTDIGIDAPLLVGEPGRRMTLKDAESMDAIEGWIVATEEALKPCWKPAP